LYHFITVGTPSGEMAKAAEIRNQHFADKIKMEKKDFHRAITVNASTEEVMKKISQINFWWKKDFSGNARKFNDKFTVPFGEPSFVDFIVSEFVPDKKVVWKVTDCYLPWFHDKKEWNNTEVVFELSEENGKTNIDFTHIGLVPEVECYDVCEKGWNGHFNNLVKFINDGKRTTRIINRLMRRTEVTVAQPNFRKSLLVISLYLHLETLLEIYFYFFTKHIVR
jgi:hypothetical protein